MNNYFNYSNFAITLYLHVTEITNNELFLTIRLILLEFVFRIFCQIKKPKAFTLICRPSILFIIMFQEQLLIDNIHPFDFLISIHKILIHLFGLY